MCHWESVTVSSFDLFCLKTCFKEECYLFQNILVRFSTWGRLFYQIERDTYEYLEVYLFKLQNIHQEQNWNKVMGVVFCG